jgi:endoglucanase
VKRVAAVTAAACALALTGTLTGAGAASAAASPFAAGRAADGAAYAVSGAAAKPAVRVDQAGYATSAAKVAYVMLPHPVHRVWFRVLGKGRGVVWKASSAAYLGGWNKRYGAVYALTFTGLRQAGTYRVQVGAARSAAFRIAPAASLYASLAGNGVRYFTSERDGGDVVPSVLDRKPANLTDAHAYAYANPKYDSNDTLIGGFTKTGGPVDVSGGWFDAGGGYEKFGFTASYADALLLIAGRDAGPAGAGLRSEARFGLDWMRKLWDPARKVMYVQVGIGNGNAKINGDYDFWFLPQAEDALNARPGDKDYYVEYRPVFAAAAPGRKVSPELAGRYAADYALGAQLAGPGSSGRQLLALARSVYAMAQTSGVRSLVTAFPHDYYPATEWKSAMLWGAAEIALADERLGVQRAQLARDLGVAARWARAYLAQGHPAGGDTLNLYDNGAIAEAELLRALRCAASSGLHGAPVIAPRLLLGDLAAQLRLGESAAARDPFGLGTPLGASDAAPHAFGLFVTEALYRQYGGPPVYAAFAQRQLDYALGANPWGASFVVGAGSSFPYCMQSEIANLSGSLTGSGALQLGATVDGPSNPANFTGLGSVAGMRACSHRGYAAFNNATAGYEDNVVSWPSVEPADDYTAISLFAFALGSHGALGG